MQTVPFNKAALRERLLAWYDREARRLPWRVGPKARREGVRSDPYKVWLSEVMLQQTTIAHAKPYFDAFVARWPTVHDLAAAPDDAVMSAWAGLGYYARARNLLACARAISSQFGGVFPQTTLALRALPGVGEYTAAALTAIAFDAPANVVDGNVERVMSRLFAVETPLPAAKGELKRLAGELSCAERPGDWAQALMDLGATVCVPKNPQCGLCPIEALCAAQKSRNAADYPRKTKKAERPHRFGVAYVAVRAGRIALVRRAPRGLLGGMLALPSSDWGPAPPSLSAVEGAAPLAGLTWRSMGEIEHVFTHFSLTMSVFYAEAHFDAPAMIWTPTQDAALGLPSVFLKALRKALLVQPH